jgi:hypothetical protein
MLLFLKLLLAHLIGDFILQPDSWVADKRMRKIRSTKLYWHIGIHLVTMLLLVMQPEYFVTILLIAITHFIIDLSKLYLESRWPTNWWFALDQLCHIAILGFVANSFTGFFEEWLLQSNFNAIVLTIVALVTVSVVASRIIKMLISNWTPETEDADEESLSNAGHYIGMLERLFVFGFVVSGNIQAVGFLLAAKSVFRFGDLKESKDRKLTEYILIGSLLSFGIAILIAMLYLYAREALIAGN